MTAFLKIDFCHRCRQEKPWEWVAPILVGNRTLAGTGVWRSQFLDGLCPACVAATELKRQKEQRDRALRDELIELLGGEKPYREFTFERYQVTSKNRLAFERAKAFNPPSGNLYLWGACGVGKTHLACAIARHGFEQHQSVVILRPGQAVRKVRMREPHEEQAILDQWVQAKVIILDDFGSGTDTVYSRQILQEVLDLRDFQDRGGMVVTSKYSLADLARKLGDDTIPSRLGGMCRVIEVRGPDRRLGRSRSTESHDG
jgi:DNA replication protein DnaC